MIVVLSSWVSSLFASLFFEIHLMRLFGIIQIYWSVEFSRCLHEEYKNNGIYVQFQVHYTSLNLSPSFEYSLFVFLGTPGYLLPHHVISFVIREWVNLMVYLVYLKCRCTVQNGINQKILLICCILDVIQILERQIDVNPNKASAVIVAEETEQLYKKKL